MYSFSGEWNDANYDFANRVLIEYIPGNEVNDIASRSGEWQMAPVPGALRVGPEPFNGDWWQILLRMCRQEHVTLMIDMYLMKVAFTMTN